jgi:hypothetical protein
MSSSFHKDEAVKNAAHKSILTLATLSLTLLGGGMQLCAQEEPQPPSQEKPKPAGSTYPIPLVNSGQDQTGSDNGLTPDTTPLTGIQEPTLGSPEILHSYWVPGISWSGAIQSNSYNQTQGSSWLMNNYLIGNLSLLQAWSGAQFAVNYSAGGFFSSDSSEDSGSYHQLALSQTFQRNRWTMQLLDQFSYLPQSSLGFGGGTGLGIPGGGSVGPVIPGMGTSYVPNQSIFASVGPRYSNASAVQLTYATSARSSITASGSYGLLHFVRSGNVDNDMTTGTIGYNYNFTRENSLGVFYRFSAYHYSGQPQANGDHSANFAFGRKLTGRLALQVYAGPDFTTNRIATNGNTISYGVSTGANLHYAFENGGFSVNYTHGMSGGSGVLAGSTADQLSSNVNHKLGRIWTGQLNMGYSRNTPIASISPVTTPSYNTWNVGTGVNRNLGRNATFAIAYNATITDYGTAGCVGTACSSSQTYHYITLNFQWHTRPFVLP